MSWQNILKDYGDTFKKPDGSTFVEGFGYIQKPYRKDKAPVKRDKQGKLLPKEEQGTKSALINWFNTFLLESFGALFDRLGQSSVSQDPKDEALMRRDETASTKGMKRLGLELAQINIETMLEGYLQSITGDTGTGEPPKSFSDTETNIQGIMGSSGYGRVMEAALKFTEEQLSSIFDINYQTARKNLDLEPDEDDDGEDIDFTAEPPEWFKQDTWGSTGGAITQNIRKLIDNVDSMLDDVIGDGDKNIFDLDGDGKPDINNEDISKNIKTSLQKVYSSSSMKDKLVDFTSYAAFTFQIKLVRRQLDMESDEEVADQVTEEQAEEYRNRPEVQTGGEDYDEEARRKLEDEFKSNDKYTGEFGWQSILSKRAGIGLTSNAGFVPAIRNISYKKPCKTCKDKKTSCGCGK